MITFVFNVLFGYVLFFFLKKQFTYIKLIRKGQKPKYRLYKQWHLRLCRIFWHPVSIKSVSTQLSGLYIINKPQDDNRLSKLNVYV